MGTSPDKAYLISGRDYEYFKRAAAKVHNLRGTGITNGYDTLSIAIPAPRRRDAVAIAGGSIVRVVITGNASGGGKYTGRILGAPESTVSASGNLTAADLGAEPDADNALVLNPEEVGASTHWLSASFLPLVFIGQAISKTSDGKTVVVIVGSQGEDCE